MKSILFLIAFSISTSCCAYAEDIAPQPIPVEDAQIETAPEGQALACTCEDCEEEEVCKCGCNKAGEMACRKCGRSCGRSLIFAGCGCKKKKNADNVEFIVRKHKKKTPVVTAEESEEAAA